LIRVIVALGTAAPEGSRTVPLSAAAAVPACAAELTEIPIQIATVNIAELRILKLRLSGEYIEPPWF
jgi:hypothetical protein